MCKLRQWEKYTGAHLPYSYRNYYYFNDYYVRFRHVWAAIIQLPFTLWIPFLCREYLFILWFIAAGWFPKISFGSPFFLIDGSEKVTSSFSRHCWTSFSNDLELLYIFLIKTKFMAIEMIILLDFEYSWGYNFINPVIYKRKTLQKYCPLRSTGDRCFLKQHVTYTAQIRVSQYSKTVTSSNSTWNSN